MIHSNRSWRRNLSLLALGMIMTAAGTSAQTSPPNPSSDTLTRRAGDREFSIGGGGATNKDFDESFGGINFAYGWYTSPTQLLVVRQTANYSNPNNGGQQWNGSTRLAFDQHFAASGALRPFVGVNVGGVYGDSVRDTFAAGLEGGAKYYVQPRTFVYAMAEYGWYFRRARSLDDRFDDGQFTWSVGVGFNF